MTWALLEGAPLVMVGYLPDDPYWLWLSYVVLPR
jgi:hypothetical protein